MVPTDALSLELCHLTSDENDKLEIILNRVTRKEHTVQLYFFAVNFDVSNLRKDIIDQIWCKG